MRPEPMPGPHLFGEKLLHLRARDLPPGMASVCRLEHDDNIAFAPAASWCGERVGTVLSERPAGGWRDKVKAVDLFKGGGQAYLCPVLPVVAGHIERGCGEGVWIARRGRREASRGRGQTAGNGS